MRKTGVAAVSERIAAKIMPNEFTLEQIRVNLLFIYSGGALLADVGAHIAEAAAEMIKNKSSIGNISY